jgi:thioredoxin 1
MSYPSRIAIVATLALLVFGLLLLKQRQPTPLQPEATPSLTERALPRLVDVGAGQCIPCKMMMPVLEELKAEYAGRLDVQYIDIIEHRELADRHNASVVPTQIFYDATGEEMYRHEGFFAKADILAKWKELGVSFEPDSAADSNADAALSAPSPLTSSD